MILDTLPDSFLRTIGTKTFGEGNVEELVAQYQSNVFHIDEQMRNLAGFERPTESPLLEKEAASLELALASLQLMKVFGHDLKIVSPEVLKMRGSGGWPKFMVMDARKETNFMSIAVALSRGRVFPQIKPDLPEMLFPFYKDIFEKLQTRYAIPFFYHAFRRNGYEVMATSTYSGRASEEIRPTLKEAIRMRNNREVINEVLVIAEAPHWAVSTKVVREPKKVDPMVIAYVQRRNQFALILLGSFDPTQSEEQIIDESPIQVFNWPGAN